ncbi:OadG family protein [Marinobacter hydrocarbonoclasticus]|nr:OadG family protein [Marinobacter nauticus]
METLTPLLAQAASLMVMGMVLVFAFLGCLVIGLKAMAWACAPRGTEELNQSPEPSISPSVVAAISAAIHAHRRAKQR